MRKCDKVAHFDFYHNDRDNPVLVHRPTGLNGMWALGQLDEKIESLSRLQWGSAEKISDYEGNCDRIVGLQRSLEMVKRLGNMNYSLEGKKVLDAACGNGNFAFVAALLGAEVHGFDVSRGQLALLEKSFSDEQLLDGIKGQVLKTGLAVCDQISPFVARKGNLENLIDSCESGSMDAVVFKYALHWANLNPKDRPSVFDQAKSVLKPGGDLILMTTVVNEQKPNLFLRGFNAATKDMHEDGYKFGHFAEGERPTNPNAIFYQPALHSILKRAGFTITDTQIYSETSSNNVDDYLKFIWSVAGHNLTDYVAPAPGYNSLSEKDLQNLIRSKMKEIAVAEDQGSQAVSEMQCLIRAVKV